MHGSSGKIEKAKTGSGHQSIHARRRRLTSLVTYASQPLSASESWRRPMHVMRKRRRSLPKMLRKFLFLVRAPHRETRTKRESSATNGKVSFTLHSRRPPAKTLSCDIFMRKTIRSSCCIIKTLHIRCMCCSFRMELKKLFCHS